MNEQHTEFPVTRASLLLQLKSPDDETAWQDFVAIYRPVIYRIARKRGLQDADAQDLTQKVLVSIAGAIANWERRDESVRFRHWLRRVARNAIVNTLTRKPQDAATGGTGVQNLLADHAADNEPLDREVTLEHRRELYFRAAAEVQAEVAPETWQVFQLAVVEDIPIEDVAERVGKSVGAAYACRGRVINRLRNAVQRLEEES